MKRSTLVPLALLVYLGVMSYIGFGEFRNGHYFYYFGIIGVTLAAIVLLHFTLRRSERLREQRRKGSDDSAKK